MTKYSKSRIFNYISKKEAIKELDISEDDFEKACVYLSIFPVIGKAKQSIGSIANDFCYKLSDIRKIGSSTVYHNIKINKKIDIKKQQFQENNLIDKANNIKYARIRLIPFIKNKYKSFGESLCDLGNSLKFIYLAKLLKISNFDIQNEFENFIIEKRILNYGFMSVNGIYYQLNVEDKMVLWMIPYKINDLNNFYKNNLFKYEDIKFFNEMINSVNLLYNDNLQLLNNNTSTNTWDINFNYLKHAIPLLEMHIKLVIHKLKMMEIKNITVDIFKDKTFSIKTVSIKEQLEFTIKCLGGQINENGNIIVCDDISLVCLLEPTKLYVQSQFIFDCLNKKEFLDPQLYLTGKILPKHISPFKSVFDIIDTQTITTLSKNKQYKLLSKVKKLK